MADRYIARLQIDITPEQQAGLQKFPKGSRTVVFGIIIDQLLELAEKVGFQKVVGGIMTGKIRLETSDDET